MKRISTFVTAALALGALALLPSIASARHGHSSDSNSTTTDSSGHGQRGHHQRGRPAEASGMIDSFTNGVLTIKQADGSTVSGLVSDRTHIQCEGASTSPAAQTRRHGDSGGSQGGGENQGSGSSNSGDNNTASGDDNSASGNDNNDQAEAPETGDVPAQSENEATETNDQNEPAEQENGSTTPSSATPGSSTRSSSDTGNATSTATACDATALKPGVTVRRARLRGTGGTATYKQIKLEI